MPHIITRKVISVEQNWLQQLANAISDPLQLLQQLEIDPSPWQDGFEARKLLRSGCRKVLSIACKKAILPIHFYGKFYR